MERLMKSAAVAAIQVSSRRRWPVVEEAVRRFLPRIMVHARSSWAAMKMTPVIQRVKVNWWSYARASAVIGTGNQTGFTAKRMHPASVTRNNMRPSSIDHHVTGPRMLRALQSKKETHGNRRTIRVSKAVDRVARSPDRRTDRRPCFAQRNCRDADGEHRQAGARHKRGRNCNSHTGPYCRRSPAANRGSRKK